MRNGTIKKIVSDKGFGFITPEGSTSRGPKDGSFFFHRTGVNGNFDELYEGQKVSFIEEASSKGPRATDVRPLE